MKKKYKLPDGYKMHQDAIKKLEVSDAHIDQQIKQSVDKVFQNLQDNPGLQIIKTNGVRFLQNMYDIEASANAINSENLIKVMVQLEEANELLYRVYKDVCDEGDIKLNTSIKVTDYVMKHCTK